MLACIGSFVIFQGILTSIAKKPYNFVIFQGGPDPLPPSGSAHENKTSEHDQETQGNTRKKPIHVHFASGQNLL